MAKKKQSADVDVDGELIDTRVRVSKHPRARRQIRAAKGWSGLLAFLLVDYLALTAGMTFFDAGVRALLAGIGAYLLAWMAAVVIWRQLVVAEVEALRRQLIAAAEAAVAERAESDPRSGSSAQPNFS